jgi:hypothetical protein
VWSEEAMAKAIANPRFLNRIEHGVLHGELGQPKRYVGDDPEYFLHRTLQVSLENSCCSVTEVKIEDSKLMAAMKPAGRWKGSLEQMLEDQVPLTLGIRALTETQNGEVVVRDIVTFDVINPQ